MAEMKKRGRKAEPGFTSFTADNGEKVKVGAKLKTDVSEWNTENVYTLAKASAEAKCRLRAKNDYNRLLGDIQKNIMFRDGMMNNPKVKATLAVANQFMADMGMPVEMPKVFVYSESEIMGTEDEEVEDDAE